MRRKYLERDTEEGEWLERMRKEKMMWKNDNKLKGGWGTKWRKELGKRKMMRRNKKRKWTEETRIGKVIGENKVREGGEI